jgi:hypothetical protein
MVQKCCPKPSKFVKQLSSAAKTRKVQKKEAPLNDRKDLGPHFGYFGDHFGCQNGAKILFVTMQKTRRFQRTLFNVLGCFLKVF